MRQVLLALLTLLLACAVSAAAVNGLVGRIERRKSAKPGA